MGEFNLAEVYGIPSSELYKAVDELESNINLRVNEEGTFTIEVTDRDPVRVASMARSIVTILDQINQKLGTTEARSNREFLEQRVADNLQEMRKTEEALKDFQEKHGFLIPNDKNTWAISAASFPPGSPTDLWQTENFCVAGKCLILDDDNKEYVSKTDA